MKHKILMTLALLLTAVTGAWADWTGGTYTATTNEELGAIIVGADATLTINEGVTVTVSGGISAIGTLTVKGAGMLTVTGANGADGANSAEYDGGGGGSGSAGFTGTLIVDGATVNVTGGNGGNGGSGLQYGGNGGSGAAGVSGSITLNIGSVTVTGGAGGNGGHGGFRDGSGGRAGQAVTETITAWTAEESDDNSTWTAIPGTTSSKRYVRAESTAPAVEVIINDTKTEASFEMPTFDVTVKYELVRDMSIQMTAQVGDGTQEQPRYRVKKDGNNKFIPADMEMAAVPALFTVNDAIEQKALTQTQDYIVQIYAIDAEGQPTGDPMTFATFTFEPGIYAVKAVAAQGSDYDGETALSNTFKLFQGYEVQVAAKEFVTFYKDEPIYVEDEAAELYTITKVADNKVELSNKRDVIPANYAMLVYNNSDEDKTILLIPAEQDPLAFMGYGGFIGTLVATTIPASTETTTNYAMNGKAFVYVKNAIEIGANKAWLEIPAAASSAHKLEIVFDGNMTGVNGVIGVKEVNDGSWYDLNGRKLQGKPTKKGVYILNGKKVVVK